MKYCSERCKRSRPSGAADSLDAKIEKNIESLLAGDTSSREQIQNHGLALRTSNPKAKPKKGDRRIILSISDIETAVFGDRQDSAEVFGRAKDRGKRGAPDEEEWTSVDMDDNWQTEQAIEGKEAACKDRDGAILTPSHTRPPQSDSEVDFSVRGERGWTERIEGTPEMLQKRRGGQERAEEREMIKRAARRAVVFGISTVPSGVPSNSKKDDGQTPARTRRKCEALVNGNVVEPSFAKGDWSLRWRED